MHNTDPDLEKCLSFFISCIGMQEWLKRRTNIIANVEETIFRLDPNFLIHDNESIYNGDDHFGWTLFLLESFLDSGLGQSPIESARYGLFFQRIGTDLSLLKKIEGIEDRVLKLVNNKGITPESGFFEIVIALLWARNGWKVKFINESNNSTPDILATKSDQIYFIECKKLQSIPEYAYIERSHWKRLFKNLSGALLEKKISRIFDITFHSELSSLPDDYLVEKMQAAFLNSSMEGNIVQNDNVTITSRPLPLENINQHLKKFFIKYPSNQISELFFEEADSNKSYNTLISGKLVRKGNYEGNNCFIDSVNFACGIAWKNDSQLSLDQKSRHVRKQLFEASQQIPPNDRGAIHFGIDTFLGSDVETLRSLKNIDTIQEFNFTTKNIDTVYLHNFRSSSPPDEPWIIDETVQSFGRTSDGPLEGIHSVTPFDDIEEGAHWEKP